MKRLLTSAIAVSMLAGVVATAHAGEDRDDGRYGRHGSHQSRDWRDDHRYEDRYDRGRDHRGYDRGYNGRRHGRYHAGEYRRPMGYYHRSWHRGDRLPRAYRAPVYVVNHYHHYNLRRPPRGYHWVRVDNDIVLAAIATGIVSEVIGGLFY